MYGDAMGGLYLYAVGEGNFDDTYCNSGCDRVWSMYGDQGSGWSVATIDLSGGSYTYV